MMKARWWCVLLAGMLAWAPVHACDSYSPGSDSGSSSSHSGPPQGRGGY